jgi:hypothetical protein
MKYARAHRRAGIMHQPGDPFTGTVQSARFLYQRGVLEPNGDPLDHEVTKNPGPRAEQRWNITDDTPHGEEE